MVPVKPVAGVKVYVPLLLIIIDPAFVTAVPESSTPDTVVAVAKGMLVPPILADEILFTPSSLVINWPATGVFINAWLISFSAIGPTHTIGRLVIFVIQKPPLSAVTVIELFPILKLDALIVRTKLAPVPTPLATNRAPI